MDVPRADCAGYALDAATCRAGGGVMIELRLDDPHFAENALAAMSLKRWDSGTTSWSCSTKSSLKRMQRRQLMTDMERKTFCAALRRYGAQAQITMAFEEMAELQDVLCKFLRGRVDGDTLANIAEEIADVGIMLDQMAIEFEVEDAVAEQRAYKVRRLRERIEKDG